MLLILDLSDFVTFPVIRCLNGIDKVIFTNALYKIIKYDEINDTIEAVYFKDTTDLDYFYGGDSTTDYDYIISGDSTTDYDYYSGGSS